MSNPMPGKPEMSDPMPGRPIRITVPASITHNLEKMQGATKAILTKLGCGTCHSGFDLRFFHEDDFRINEKGEIM